MTLRHRCLSLIVLAFAVAALVVPVAEAGPGHSNLVGQTEAKGYAALSQAILNTSRLQSHRAASQTEAKGYAALSQAILNTSRLQSHRAASQTEAKGYAALSQAILNTSRLQSQSPAKPQVEPRGFGWGDAGIGAAATLGLLLLAGGLSAAVILRGRSGQPKHA